MDFIYQYDLHLVFRLIVAGICGIAVGFERKHRAKEAGIRTHCLVACASALMMVLSKYAFDDLAGEFIKVDPSRIASGVASGIGFLGAGVIFVYKRTISGLTTAAGIWATAGVGLAIGSGMYVVGLSATFIILMVQFALHTHVRWLKRSKVKILCLRYENDGQAQPDATVIFRGMGISVNDISVKKDVQKDVVEYRYVLEMPAQLEESELVSKFDCDCTLTLKE